MPDRTVSFLSIAVGALVIAYLALVTATVSLAAWRTDLAAEVRDTEGAIATLEHDYYAAIERVGAISPSSLGLVKPVGVTYAAMVSGPALTRR
jgi:hypothetical protein